MIAHIIARHPGVASAAITPARAKARRYVALFFVALCYAALASACVGAPAERVVVVPRPSAPLASNDTPVDPVDGAAPPHAPGASLDQATPLALVGWGRRRLSPRLRQTYPCKLVGGPFLCGGSRVVTLRDGAFLPSPELEKGLPRGAYGTPEGVIKEMHGRWPDDAWLVADVAYDSALQGDGSVIYHWQGATWRRVAHYKDPPPTTLPLLRFGSGVYWKGTLFIERYCGSELCGARAYGGRARLPLRFATRAQGRTERDEKLRFLPSGELAFHSGDDEFSDIVGAPTWSLDLWAPDGRHESIASNDSSLARVAGDCELKRVDPLGFGRRLLIGRVRGADGARRRPCVVEQEGATFSRLSMPDIAATVIQIERDREGGWWLTLRASKEEPGADGLWHRPPGGSWTRLPLALPASLPSSETLVAFRLHRDASDNIFMIMELDAGDHDFAPVDDLVYRPGPSSGPPRPFDW